MRIRTLLTVTFLLAVAPRASEAAIIFTSHQASTTAFAQADDDFTLGFNPGGSQSSNDSSNTLADLNTAASARVDRRRFSPLPANGRDVMASAGSNLEPMATGFGFDFTRANGPPDSRGSVGVGASDSGFTGGARAIATSSLQATFTPGSSTLDYSVELSIFDRTFFEPEDAMARFRLFEATSGNLLLDIFPSSDGADTQSFNGTLAVNPSALLRLEASSRASLEIAGFGGSFADPNASVNFALRTAVPEPAAAGLLGAAGLLALLRRRRPKQDAQRCHSAVARPLAGVALALTLLQAAPALAETLDQSNDATMPFAGRSVAVDFTQAQTFTTGIAGTLSRVELVLNRGDDASEDVTLAILATDASGNPSGATTPLATASLGPAGVGTVEGVVSFDLSAANLEVSVGDVLAIQLSSPAANDPPFRERYNWYLGTDYADGKGFTNGGTNGRDFSFSTFVAVPEPATASLLGAASLLALLRRRRPKQRDGRGKRIVPLAVAGCVGTLVVAASAPAVLGQNTTVVATTGQAVPSGPGSFTRFDSAALNNGGRVAFFAFLGGSGVDDTNNSGLYRGDDMSLTEIAREGQTAPSGPGSFESFFPPSLNDLGQAAFFTTLIGSGTNNDNNTAIYRDDGGTLTQIARGGQAAPTGFENFRFVAIPTLNNKGQAAFRVGFGGVSAANDFGIYRGDGTTLVQIARTSQAAPSGPGRFTSFGSTDPALNDAGQVAFNASLGGSSGVGPTNDFGIYRGDGTSLTQIVRKGQAVPSGPGSFTGVGLRSLNGAGQVAFFATLGGNGVDATNDGGIYRGDGASLTQVVREGQAAPSGPGTFTGFPGGIAFNNAGQTAFFADLGGSGVVTTNSSGVYRAEGGGDMTLTQIARAGQVAPSGPGVFINFDRPGLFDSPALNEAGQAVFFANLGGSDVTSRNDLGLYLYDDSLGLLTVAREGDSFLGSTISDLAFTSGSTLASQRSGLNDLGQVAYLYTLADGNRGIAIFSVPEPSSLALLGLGGLALLRRRRPKHSPAVSSLLVQQSLR